MLNVSESTEARKERELRKRKREREKSKWNGWKVLEAKVSEP